MEEHSHISEEALYKIILEIRNFEISQFWQRSNYFLALNTAVAIGFFSLKTSAYAILLSIFGFLACLLWFQVVLGSKFWQERWEHRLRKMEQKLSPELQLFSVDWDTMRRDVEQSLDFAQHGSFRRFLDRLTLEKPSVSHQMTMLSLLFALLWFILLLLSLSGL
jgi:hypothetical protein